MTIQQIDMTEARASKARQIRDILRQKGFIAHQQLNVLSVSLRSRRISTSEVQAILGETDNVQMWHSPAGVTVMVQEA